MGIVTKAILVGYNNCAELATKWQNILDSHWHKSENIPVASIENLESLLDEKASTIDLGSHNTDVSAHQAQFDDKVDKVAGFALSENNYDNAAVNEVAKIIDKVDKVANYGLSKNDYDDAEKAQVNENALNKQQLITDVVGDFTLTDTQFRTTFFINTTSTINITIPTGVLRAGWVAFFHVIGTGQVTILVDGLGVTLNAPDGTMLSQGNKGMLEKQLATDTLHASGAWEV